jgi:hypothetical protein
MRKGWQKTRQLLVCAAALLIVFPFGTAQTPTPTHKKAPAKPEPTEPELVEYIRGGLLSLSPADGINDNIEVRYDETNKVLTVVGPGGACDVFLTALDPNVAVWELYHPSDNDKNREKLLRLTVISTIDKAARTCYDKAGHVNPNLATNRARFLFSQPKADDYPQFQERMAKSFKKLIALTSGTPQKDIF